MPPPPPPPILPTSQVPTQGQAMPIHLPVQPQLQQQAQIPPRLPLQLPSHQQEQIPPHRQLQPPPQQQAPMHLPKLSPHTQTQVPVHLPPQLPSHQLPLQSNPKKRDTMRERRQQNREEVSGDLPPFLNKNDGSNDLDWHSIVYPEHNRKNIKTEVIQRLDKVEEITTLQLEDIIIPREKLEELEGEISILHRSEFKRLIDDYKIAKNALIPTNLALNNLRPQYREELEKEEHKRNKRKIEDFIALSKQQENLSEEMKTTMRKMDEIRLKSAKNGLKRPVFGNGPSLDVRLIEGIPKVSPGSSMSIQATWNLIVSVGENLELNEDGFKLALLSRLGDEYLKAFQTYSNLPLMEAVKSLVDQFDNPTQPYEFEQQLASFKRRDAESVGNSIQRLKMLIIQANPRALGKELEFLTETIILNKLPDIVTKDILKCVQRRIDEEKESGRKVTIEQIITFLDKEEYYSKRGNSTVQVNYVATGSNRIPIGRNDGRQSTEQIQGPEENLEEERHNDEDCNNENYEDIEEDYEEIEDEQYDFEPQQQSHDRNAQDNVSNNNYSHEYFCYLDPDIENLQMGGYEKRYDQHYGSYIFIPLVPRVIRQEINIRPPPQFSTQYNNFRQRRH